MRSKSAGRRGRPRIGAFRPDRDLLVVLAVLLLAAIPVLVVWTRDTENHPPPPSSASDQPVEKGAARVFVDGAPSDGR